MRKLSKRLIENDFVRRQYPFTFHDLPFSSTVNGIDLMNINALTDHRWNNFLDMDRLVEPLDAHHVRSELNLIDGIINISRIRSWDSN